MDPLNGMEGQMMARDVWVIRVSMNEVTGRGVDELAAMLVLLYNV